MNTAAVTYAVLYMSMSGIPCWGDNRLSLTVMLAGEGKRLFLSGISAAGGGGVGKIIPWGEEEFLNVLKKLADQLTG